MTPPSTAAAPVALGGAQRLAPRGGAARATPRYVAMAVAPGGRGYWAVTARGQVDAYGDARDYGWAGGRLGHAHVVGIAAAHAGAGFWLVTDRGAVMAFGSAAHGRSADPGRGDHVVAIAATPDGRGYWLASASGRVWPCGDAAPIRTHAQGVHDIVALAAAPGGRGLWLASRRGGVISLGSARFHGSAIGSSHAGAIVGIAPTGDGGGYWLAAASGQVLAFGDARGHAAASAGAPRAAVAIAAPPDGPGYWLVPGAAPGPPPPRISGHVTAIGDSVMLDVAPDLEAAVPGIDVEAAVSRQWQDGVTLAQQLRAQGRLGSIVVVDLGTNGPFSAQQFDEMMSALSSVSRVVFVTVHLPASYSWSQSVNATLAAGVARYRTARLADFNALARQHPEWFGTDGVHMAIGGPGAQAMATLIRAQL